jgi:hypothetical protein
MRWLHQSVGFLTAAADHAPDGPAAYDSGAGMRNLLSYRGAWQDTPHLGDHVGRAIWALGVVVSSPTCPRDVRSVAANLLDRLAPTTGVLTSVGLRSCAYALIGLSRAERPEAELRPLVGALHTALRTNARPGWYWFEQELTYDNARLPQALLAGAVRLGDSELVADALRALDWYLDHVRLGTGMLRCVGNLWHRHGEAQKWGDDGDEQPIDAAACVEALVAAWQHTGSFRYAREARTAFEWFRGRNRVGAPLYSPTTGGCFDGLSTAEVNGNQGAESTLAYYQALLSLVGSGLAALPDRVAVTRPAGGTAEHVVGALGVRTAKATGAASDRTPSSAAGKVQPSVLRHGARARTTEGPPDAR